MAKTQEELTALKEEVEILNKKLHELTKEELAQVTGGWAWNEGSRKEEAEQHIKMLEQPLPADPGPLTQFPTTKQRGIGTVPAAVQNKEILEKLLSTVTEFETPDLN